jgi:HPr kinase/phosphorylase
MPIFSQPSFDHCLMPERVSLADLVEALTPRIGMTYVHGKITAAECILYDDTAGGPSMVGHLNMIRPNRIQVIGRTEADYLEAMAPEERDQLLQDLAAKPALAIVFAENTCPFDALLFQSPPQSVPVMLCSRAGSHEVIALVRYFLQQRLARAEIRHGVFMEILGTGVLITGESSVGKSEVALELISRGHRLIADDAPEFARITPDIIRGTCPPVLQDMLEVRGLGVLNIRAMYGDSAIKNGKHLRLVIQLQNKGDDPQFEQDRLEGVRGEAQILGMHIPMVSLSVAPGRNIAVLIEAAVRAHLLRLQGYVAGRDLQARQRQMMEEGSPGP